MTENDQNEIKNYLESQNKNSIVLDPYELKNLIVYGCGKIASQIIEKTRFFKTIKNFEIVDGNPDKIGKHIFNKTIKRPSSIKENESKIFIAAAQSYDEIYKNIVKIKGNDKNIISGLIL